MKKITLICIFTCCILLYLTPSCEAREKNRFRKRMGVAQLSLNNHEKRSNRSRNINGLTQIKNYLKRKNHRWKASAKIDKRLNHKRKNRKSSSRRNYAKLLRQKLRRKMQRHPLQQYRHIRAEHNKDKIQTLSLWTTRQPLFNTLRKKIRVISNASSTGVFSSDGSRIESGSKNETDDNLNPATRNTVVGGSNSPCISSSDCLPGHCCMKKKNKVSRCKSFMSPSGKKCWDTCMCANGMGCYIDNKRINNRRRRTRKKDRHQKGVCKIPETDDVLKGIYLKI